MIKSLAVLAVIGNAAMLLVATISTTMTPTPAAATTGIGSKGDPISAVYITEQREESTAEYTTFAIRMEGIGADRLTTWVASGASINLVLIANIPEGLYSNDPNLDQLVTYNETRQINVTDFIEYKECSLTCEPETLYQWRINNTDIQAEIPQPTRPESTVYPPHPGLKPYDIIVLTTPLLPSGDVIE